MAGLFIRRGEMVGGPYSADQLKLWRREGKLLPSDSLAKDAGGPWTPASQTRLFAESNGATTITVSPVTHPNPPVVGTRAVATINQEDDDPPTGPVFAILRVAGVILRFAVSVLRTVGRPIGHGFAAVSQSFARSSQRRREAKIAELRYQAEIAAAQRLTIQAASPPPPAAPTPVASGMASQRVIILMTTVAGMAGTFLPWVQLPVMGSLSGTAGDGWITFGLFFVTAVAALSGQNSLPPSVGARVLCFVSAGAAGWVALAKISTFHHIIDDGAHTDNSITNAMMGATQIGSGLYLIVVAAALVCLFSMASWSKGSA